MKFEFNHDLHIHTHLSSCSEDPTETPEAILRYAVDHGLEAVCVNDHFWDASQPMCGYSPWYAPQNFEHISLSKPLPVADGVHFLFGCETEMGADGVIGVAPEHYDAFDFIVVPTTHMHFTDLVSRPEDFTSPQAAAKTWVKRIEYLLRSDLPLHKVGLAHMTTCLLFPSSREQKLATLDAISDAAYTDLFRAVAEKGIGVELNSELGGDLESADGSVETILRPYFLAKEAGCKFYLGSDTHRSERLPFAKGIFERVIDRLALTADNQYDFRKLYR